MGPEVDRSLGRLEGHQQALETRLSAIEVRLAAVDMKADLLVTQMASVSGAWRLLVGVATISAGFAATVVQVIHWLKKP